MEWIMRFCFLDASDDVLIKRYKETRRNHPLAGDGRVDKGIRKRACLCRPAETESGLYNRYEPTAHARIEG